MIAFTVHEPPNPPSDRIERAERLEFVRDGFSWLAAVIPPLWMVLNKLWVVLLGYLLLSTGASWLLARIGVDKSMIGLINLAANLVIGYEAASLQRWTLSRRNWTEAGAVVGRNQEECERRFFDGWLDQQPVLRRPEMADRLPTPAPAAAPLSGERTDGTARRPLWRRVLQR